MDSVAAHANAGDDDAMRHRRVTGVGLAMLFAAILVPASMLADGGVVCLRKASGPFVITVFINSAELRAGPADVSVMVQNRASREIVLDADVLLRLQSIAPGGQVLESWASRKQATNKLLESAIVDLPSSGEWKLTVLVRRGSEKAIVSTRLQVAPPLPRLAAMWPFLALPVLAMMLFAANQALRQRERVPLRSRFGGSREDCSESGSGGEDRTPDLGIMRPSLYH
jgi:hypothetical protein